MRWKAAPSCSEPGTVRSDLLFVTLYFVVCRKREADLVGSMEQAIPAKRVHLEHEAVLKGRGDGAGLEIDRDRIGFRYVKQPIDRRLRQYHRQDAILECVARKNVRKAGGDHRRHAQIVEGPGGMLAARPTAEIIAGDNDG